MQIFVQRKYLDVQTIDFGQVDFINLSFIKILYASFYS